jgi:hypothetical protein
MDANATGLGATTAVFSGPCKKKVPVSRTVHVSKTKNLIAILVVTMNSESITLLSIRLKIQFDQFFT